MVHIGCSLSRNHMVHIGVEQRGTDPDSQQVVTGFSGAPGAWHCSWDLVSRVWMFTSTVDWLITWVWNTLLENCNEKYIPCIVYAMVLILPSMERFLRVWNLMQCWSHIHLQVSRFPAPHDILEHNGTHKMMSFVYMLCVYKQASRHADNSVAWGVGIRSGKHLRPWHLFTSFSCLQTAWVSCWWLQRHPQHDAVMFMQHDAGSCSPQLSRPMWWAGINYYWWCRSRIRS